jgi:hypothetical protein
MVDAGAALRGRERGPTCAPVSRKRSSRAAPSTRPPPDEEQASARAQSTRVPLLLTSEAVARTPDELAGSVLRVGSENRHPVCRERTVRYDVVAHGCSGVHFLAHAPAFSKRLYATPSSKRSTADLRARSSSLAPVSAAFGRGSLPWRSDALAATVEVDCQTVRSRLVRMDAEAGWPSAFASVAG